MKTFKAKKELLFVVLPDDARYIKVVPFYGDRLKLRTHNHSIPLPYGNWQLISKLSETKEDVARDLVDEWNTWGGNKEYENYLNEYDAFDTSTESLNSIATHLEFNLNDNIYILTKTVGDRTSAKIK